MPIQTLFSLAFLIAINITDIRGYKIKNAIVLPMILLGLLVGVFVGDFRSHLCGMLIPLVLFPFYALRMLGAGDVKAFCALGAMSGIKLCVTTITFSFLSGGIMAIGFIIFHKNGRERMRYFFQYLKACLLSRKPLSYDFGGEGKNYFRFSYAISTGYLIAVLAYHAGVNII